MRLVACGEKCVEACVRARAHDWFRAGQRLGEVGGCGRGPSRSVEEAQTTQARIGTLARCGARLSVGQTES